MNHLQPMSNLSRMTLNNSPLKLTTHFRGWSRVLALSLMISLIINFGLIYANIKQSENFSLPRVVYKSQSGIVLPLASTAFVWTPEVATQYVKFFLPVVYSFTPDAVPELETWAPFVNAQLLRAAKDRYKKNEGQIKSDGLSQTLFVQSVTYDSASECAKVIGELRIIDRNGQLSRTPVTFTVELPAISDPLNAYGHYIQNIY